MAWGYARGADQRGVDLIQNCEVTGIDVEDAVLERARLPVLPTVANFLAQGISTGASGRNWASYGEHIDLPAHITAAEQALLTDPQTSGGLLVSCAPGAVDAVLAAFAADGFGDACIVGHMQPGAGRVQVR